VSAPVRVGDYVRFLGCKGVLRVSRVWTIDRGPDAGRVKASALEFVNVRGYRGWASSTHAAIECFEPFPYAGPVMPLPGAAS